MATERKKRKLRLFKFKKTKPKNETVKETKAKKPAEPKEEHGEKASKLKVINGTRKRNRIIRFIVYGVILAVIIALIVVNILTPTGLVEALQNSYSAMGEGTYPINVYSTNARSYSSWNGMQAMINESFFELYNTDGKLVHAASHGMSDPQLEVSEARYLLYDRDRYTAVVYNYSDELYTVEADSTIAAADIGRNGTFAIVTDSDTYQSTVSVYNRDNESVYTWNSANFYVTDVAVADDGQSIAVCMLNAQGGVFESYVYILGFDGAEPVCRYTFSDIVSSLTSCGESYILANGFDRAYTVPWNGGAELDLKISGVVRRYDYEVNSASCVISGREDNEQINTVTVLNSAGGVNVVFDFNAAVNDVCVSQTSVAVLTDNEVFVYDHFGKLLSTYRSSVKGDFVGIDDDGTVFVLDSSKLVRLEQ